MLTGFYRSTRGSSISHCLSQARCWSGERHGKGQHTDTGLQCHPALSLLAAACLLQLLLCIPAAGAPTRLDSNARASSMPQSSPPRPCQETQQVVHNEQSTWATATCKANCCVELHTRQVRGVPSCVQRCWATKPPSRFRYSCCVTATAIEQNGAG